VQKDAHACLYPADTMQPTETGCITAIEAMAAYAPLITTDCDCLGEEFGESGAIAVPLPFRPELYIDAIDQVISNGDLFGEMVTDGRKLAETRQWKDVAPKWIELFESEASRS
jgi:glycosyltransferase involved in cell wall biosynthesis